MPIARYRLSAGAWTPWRFGQVAAPIPAGRDGLVAGTHKPTPSTVGVIDGIPLTEQGTGAAMVLSPGTYENRVFLGRVSFNNGSGTVTFRNCWFAGNDPNGTDPGGSVVKNNGSAPRLNVNMIDCTVDPSYWMTYKGRTKIWPELNGVFGGGFNVQRCEIKNVCDPVGIHAANTSGFILELSWLHKCTYATGTANTGQSDQRVHSDGVQFHSGQNITIRGNIIGGERDMVGYQTDPFSAAYNSGDDCENSCLMLKQEIDNTTTNRLENVLIEQNWFYGGMASVNFTYGADRPNRFATTVIRNNRFGRRQAGWGVTRRMDGNLKTDSTNGGLGWYILKSSNLDATITGNVFEDTGLPVPITG